MSEKKVVGKRIAVTLGIACLILLVGLVAAIVNYKWLIRNKDHTIQTLATRTNQLQTWLEDNITNYELQISSLNTQIANLQNQIDSLNSEYWDLYANYTHENWWHHYYENLTVALQTQVIDLENQTSSLHAQITNLQNQIGLLNDTVIHGDGTRLRDAFGNEVFLKGVNLHRNERRAENGRFWGIDDVKRIKDSGGNCLELNGELLCDWMPERNQINESYFINWLDKEVSWCEQYGIYYIINVRGFHGNHDWARKEPFLPDWLWEDLGYSKPTNQELADLIIRDFFDTDVQKQEINREAFINAWKFAANRYKNNKHVLFGLMNEPLCGVRLINSTVSIHLGVTYARFMERIIDAIRSTGAKQVIFVDRPYVWYLSHVQPVNRDNIVWEDHLYVTQDKSIDSWKTSMDAKVQRFVYDFGKPLYVGEHGTDNPVKPSNWQYVLSEQVAYLKNKTICGRQWHSWGWIEGEYMDHKYDYFNAEESEWIINTVLGD